jgi:SAM-dependent methyltransferase
MAADASGPRRGHTPRSAYHAAVEPGQRTHDAAIYVEESRYERPKELFREVGALIEAAGLPPEARIADVGCAAGEFLHYLRRLLPAAQLYGFDVLPDLIEKARAWVPDAELAVGSVLDEDLAPRGSFDVVTLVGVHSIFDDIEPVLRNVLSWTRPGGRAFVVGLFNEHPVDVWVRYRLAEGHPPEHRESGWNVFSRVSVERFLAAELGTGAYRFVPFTMPIDLDPHPSDPVRTWTLATERGRVLVNGLSLIVNIEILELRP